jgi:flagellar hook-basal body complex protein FliE
MIEPIAPLASLGDIAPSARATPVETAPGFERLVLDGMGGVNQQLNAADQATRALAAGAEMPVHDVMIALERARIDLQFVVQVRNRVLSAYRDITSMQV